MFSNAYRTETTQLANARTDPVTPLVDDAAAIAGLGHASRRTQIGDVTAAVAARTTAVAIAACATAKAIIATTQRHTRFAGCTIRTRCAREAQIARVAADHTGAAAVAPDRRVRNAHDRIGEVIAAARRQSEQNRAQREHEARQKPCRSCPKHRSSITDKPGKIRYFVKT